YYKTGLYQQRFGAKGFRLLTVVDTPTQVRADNLAKDAERIAGVGRRFWYAHLPTLTPEQVLTGAVWQVPGDPAPAALFTE
ncbi:MAG: hypothetical protein JXN59_18675, partial [Anaerolineae bacterium]|nr:hypothetical protein [Anaerolineae bacterium]